MGAIQFQLFTNNFSQILSTTSFKFRSFNTLPHQLPFSKIYTK